jgi:hypothetical protein
MQRKGDIYHKWVEWSEEDQIYIGRCPDLMRGGMHSEAGDDPVQTYSELCDLVDELVEDYEKEGKTQPMPHCRSMKDAA